MKQYDLDPETQELLEVALNCLITLSDAQIDETAKIGLMGIADKLAEAFGIDRLLEEIHASEDGEEIIYRPPNDLFGDDVDIDDDDSEPET